MGSSSSGRDAKYSPLGTDNNNSMQPLPQDSGPSSFGRMLKGLSVLILLVLLFTYTTWTFTGRRTPNSDKSTQSWSYESLSQTEIIFDTNGQPGQQAVANHPQDKAEVTSTGEVLENGADSQGNTTAQGAGPESGDARPSNMDKSDNGSDAEIQTVFSTLHSSFADLKLGESNQIPTQEFLHVAADLKPLLEAVGSSVSLVESDIRGNAEKLMKVYEENPSHCQTLQDMLTYDMEMGKADEDERSVVALTWLKRAFEFVERFLSGIANGKEPTSAAETAYNEVLSKHHSWMTRTAFRLATKILPSRHNFLRKLVVNEADLDKPHYEADVTADMKLYLKSMRHVFAILRDFFTQHHLEN